MVELTTPKQENQMSAPFDGTEEHATAGTEVSHWHRPMGRRNVIAGIAGIGVAAGIGATRVVAQDATPSATEEPGTGTGTDQTTKDAEIGAAYQDFVGKLTTNLGESDPTKVDTAIRDALKAMVDEQFDAGTISANLRDDLKSRIDSSDFPLGVAMLAGMREHRVELRRKRRKDRQDDDQSGEDDGGSTTQPSTTSTPTI
jgi:hypothetical protein